MMQTSLTSEEILGPGGRLSRRIDGFEYRPSQLEMALLIEKALRERSSVMVEAGTGTGKTFGYLVPVLLSGKKTVISTGTKNLQEQVYKKDIPLLGKATGLKIDAMMMKGRKNYLCLHKFHQHYQQQTLLKGGAESRRKLEKWLETTRFGDRGELSWLADEDPLWDALSASSDQCIGLDCMFLEDCFLAKLRSRAAGARLIIVNHHLFFADMKVKKGGFGEIIPRFQVAVFDEAHNIEEIATTHFGESISTRQVTEFVGETEKQIKGLASEDRVEAGKPLDAIRGALEVLKTLLDAPEDRGRIDGEALDQIRNGPARDIRRGLAAFSRLPFIKKTDHLEWPLLLERAGDLDHRMEEVVSRKDATWLNWYERRKRSLVLHASPLDVSGSMNSLLYEKVHSVVLTSATLSTNNRFDYIRGRLGLPEETLEGLHTSHFDFETQTLLYLPRNLPAPGDNRFPLEAAAEIRRILMRSKGRALVLFTSHFNLNRVYEVIAGEPPFTVFKQGDAPRSILLEKFKKDIQSVLLATGSFWQGVDVPGEALSCLIIDKLPFASPADPLVAARIEALREEGGNPFMEYQVPAAVISLKQGLGRLIRKGSDRGVMAILDKRIVTSRYGGIFLKSLPPIPVVHDPEEIERFFSKGALK